MEVPRALCLALHQTLLSSPTLVASDLIQAKTPKLMTSLQFVIQTHGNDPGAQQHASGIIKVLLSNEKIRADFQIDRALMELVGLAADHHQSDLGVLQEAMGALFFCTLVDTDVAPALAASVHDC